MKNTFYIMALLLFTISITQAQKVFKQTDWHGGPEANLVIEASRTNWETDAGIKFTTSTNINYLYEWGRISLAAEMNEDPAQHQIDVYNRAGSVVQTGDMDGDGDIDVVAGDGSGTYVVWYENLGAGVFNSNEKVIYARGWTNFTLGDVNKDGYTDILTNDDHRVWLDLNDHSGGFTRYEVGSSADGDCIGIADFDNDEDIDIVSSAYQYNDLIWFGNNGSSTAFTGHLVEDRYYGQAEMPHVTADLDNDGDIDFVSINNNPSGTHLHWWENDINSTGTFIEHSIDENYGSRRIYGFDMDRDGDVDIITTRSFSSSLDWWENNGSGNFTQHSISTSYNTLGSSQDYGAGVSTLDLDWDGDVDIVTSSYQNGTLDWWENDGSMNFTQHTFATGYTHGSGVWIDDISGRGFYEVASTAHRLRVDWWELFDHFKSPGELISPIFDAGAQVVWTNISWHDTTKHATLVYFQVRASNNKDNMGAWSDTIRNGTSLNGYIEGYKRYFQYKAVLLTPDSNWTPFLYDVSIDYRGGDIGVDSIAYPQDSVVQGDTIPLKVLIKNYKRIFSDQSDVYITIEDTEGNIILADTGYVDRLSPLADDYELFDKKWVVEQEEGDTLIVKSWTDMEADLNTTNDLCIDTTYVKERPGGIEERGVEGIAIHTGIGYIVVVGNVGNISIYTLTGEKVYEGKAGRVALKTGVYFVRFNVAGREVKRKVVVY